jgi:SAM-dependent methyltransferase
MLEAALMPGPKERRDDEIIDAYRAHYAASFARHGATSRGVDWGEQSDVDLRYAKMLEVIEPHCATGKPVRVLDVGCGYGGLLDYVKSRRIVVDYIGIDLVPEMIEHARERHPDALFTVGDILSSNDPLDVDYAICNGILTLKLESSILDMDRFARRLICKMFSIVRRGIAFNLMSTHVNFSVPNLYYKSPVEILAFCGELSRRFRLDHAYPLYEYTAYVYRDEAATPCGGVRA